MRRKGTRFSEAQKRKISMALKGRHLSEKTKKKLSEARKGKPLSEEHKKKLSEIKKGCTVWNKGLTKETDERVRKNALAKTGIKRSKPAWNKGLTKETDKRVQESASARVGKHWKLSSECCEKRAEILRERWATNLEYRERMKQLSAWNKGLTKETNESVLKYSRKIAEHWRDPNYKKQVVSNILKKVNSRPNHAERTLEGLLNKTLPGEYRYVGNGSFVLAGKCPDFVSVVGQKKVIELFGDYWHKDDDGKFRINLFGQHGYETLIVREIELEKEEALKQKLIDFNGPGAAATAHGSEF